MEYVGTEVIQKSVKLLFFFFFLRIIEPKYLWLFFSTCGFYIDVCCSLLRHLMYRVRGILSWVNCFIACMDIYLNLPIHVTGTRWGYQFHSWRYKYICTLNWDMQLRAKHHQRFGAVVFIKWLICVTCLFIYPLTLAQTFVLQWFSTHPQSLGTL